MKKFIYLFAFILFVHSTLMVENCLSQWVNLNSPGSRINRITSINSNLFMTSSGQGVLFSTNGGINWTLMNNGIDNLYAYQITASGNNLFVSTTGVTNKIFLSTNLGNNWSPAYNGISGNVYTLYASGNLVFAGTSAGVYYTSNNGANWLLTNLTGKSISAFAKIAGTLFAGTYGNGIFKSSDNGINWTECNNGLTTMNINALAVMGTDIFAGTNYGGAMYKSTNSGVSWAEANNGFIHLVVRDVTALGSHIFACANDSYGCIYHSTNAGQSWIMKNQGFGTLTPTFNCLYIANDYVYAGTNSNNLWRRSYQDIIGINNISSEIPDKFSLYQNYPNPFNPTTKIKFDVGNGFPVKTSGNDKVVLKVFDVTGREVQTLVNEKLQPGTYEVYF